MVRHSPRTSKADDLVTRVFGHRYEVTHEIARGGCAVVVEAVDRHLGRLVAIKVPRQGPSDAASVERLTREVRAAAAIHHPNVCSVLDWGRTDDGMPFLVMERLYGETLGAYAARVGRLDPDEAIDIAIQALSALEASHALGIIHRDIKPDNLFLVHRTGCMPVVKLLDFGLCYAVPKGAARDATLTRVGTVVGTPEYMSPEQASGFRTFDARTDVWAIGVVLYEALTGTRAFAADNVAMVLAAVMTRSLPSLRRMCPGLPPEIERVIARAMDRDGRKRIASAAEFLMALVRVRSSLAPATSETEVWVPDHEMPTKQMTAFRRRP